MLGPETAKLLESLSKRLEMGSYDCNEAWQRTWLEVQAKQQNQILQCPECDAFVPMRPDNFDNEGGRICLVCGIKFSEPE